MIKDMKGQFKEGEDDNVWYLKIFGDADVLRKFGNIWKSIKVKTEETTGGIVKFDENYMRIKCESVFAQNGKFYLQLFLDDALYEF